MATEPKCFEINVAHRYIIVVELPDGVSQRVLQDLRQGATEAFNNWWESGEKFTVVSVGKGVDIKVHRMGEDDGDEVPGVKRLTPGP